MLPDIPQTVILAFFLIVRGIGNWSRRLNCSVPDKDYRECHNSTYDPINTNERETDVI
jgi:hypothetical protein